MLTPLHTYALMGDQMQLHYRENIECLREDILKRERVLNDRKDKLFTLTAQKGDTSTWDLDPSITQEQIANLVKDKQKALPHMLSKDSTHLNDMKDLF